jgi:SAM-dependent methyltransferase
VVSRLNKEEYVHDINIYQCDLCKIAQNPDDFDHESYYQEYQYSAGHSDFTKHFMNAYAKEAVKAFESVNGRNVRSVLEVGSGDGQQLLCFKHFGVNTLLGVEPSEYLAKIANKNGVHTEVALFGTHMSSAINNTVDICISSYTFDHVRQPLDYLEAAHGILVDGGIIGIEIHDFGKIVERTEYCLFEHEHTIYLRSEDARRLLEQSGFSVISINPLSPGITRGNSLIVLARKVAETQCAEYVQNFDNSIDLSNLQDRITSTINRIDSWIRNIPEGEALVGFGAGGRGVMTMAALKEHKRIVALLDTNYKSNMYLAPKTRTPIVGPDSWWAHKDSYCIVFSFGYFNEIAQNLINIGFKREKIISLLDFYA